MNSLLFGLDASLVIVVAFFTRNEEALVRFQQEALGSGVGLHTQLVVERTTVERGGTNP